jgi:hypothetical protein
MQTNAIDREQQDDVALHIARREARIAELWRWLINDKMGREFIWEVMLADVGYDRPIREAEDIPLRNLAVRWLNTQVRRHRDKYVQMLNEAIKREDDERREDDTNRAKWARRDHEDRND